MMGQYKEKYEKSKERHGDTRLSGRDDGESVFT